MKEPIPFCADQDKDGDWTGIQIMLAADEKDVVRGSGWNMSNGHV